MTHSMNSPIALYNLSNLLSFLGMSSLFIDALGVFREWPNFNIDYVFWPIMGLMMFLMFRAKKLNPKMVNPNVLFPVARAAYFISVASFMIGYLFLEQYSVPQIVVYGISLLGELVSTFVAYSSMKNMRVQ